MKSIQLSEEEISRLQNLTEDLELIFQQDEFQPSEIDNILEEVESEEVSNYLKDLRSPSAPESALREEFFAGRALLSKWLFGEISPESHTETGGRIDYFVRGLPIQIELKPLFIPKKDSNQVIQKFKQKELNWEEYENQIERYRTDNEYLILTNLKEWYFFSKRSKEPLNNDSISFEEFRNEYEIRANAKEYLERLENRSFRGDLDEKFFESLKDWVTRLESIEFNEDVSEEEKLDLIIKTINKFIFIQTLEDHSVIPFQWLKKKWDSLSEDWLPQSEFDFLQEFLSQVNKWFYRYYDTELFKDFKEKPIWNYLKKDEDNIRNYYEMLEYVLGYKEWQGTSFGDRGISTYNYRQIDEDIFGKAYETYLVEVRKEQGIYYTPKYITRYIVEKTVGVELEEKLDEIKKEVDEKNYEIAKELIQDFISFRVLDPACGSGSFLIKALRNIWNKYQELIEYLEQKKNEFTNFESGTLRQSDEDMENLEKITRLQDELNYSTKRDLMSKIILRHLHGNDLDEKALDVAKLNIWLEAIKQAPSEYEYVDVPDDTRYILPDLEMNLTHGDSLIGLPIEDTIDYLKDNHTDELDELNQLREAYLSDTTQIEKIDELEEIMADLRKNLNEKFEDYIEENDLPVGVIDETKPFQWALSYWHIFEKKDGFDAVIGNPPYVNAIERRKYYSSSENEFWKEEYTSSFGAYDLYLIFLEKSIDLTRKNGRTSLIVPNKYLSAPYAESFRNFVIENEVYFNSLCDVSQLDVFEDPDVYPIISFFKNTSPSPNDFIQIHYPPKIDELGKEDHIRRHQHQRLKKLEENLWSFLIIEDEDVFWNIYNACESLKQQGTVQASSTASEAEEFTNAIKEGKPHGTKQKFIKTGGIDPFLSKWGYESVRHQRNDYEKPTMDISHEIITDLREEQYTKSKIIFAKVASRIEAYPDLSGEYATVDTNLFYDADEKLTYYACLLNSYLSNFIYEGLFASLRMRNGDFQFQAPQLKLIRVPKKDDLSSSVVKNMDFLGRKVLDLKRIDLHFYNIWQKFSKNYKSEHVSLEEILERDKRKIQRGNRDKCWTSDISFYPDTDNEGLKEEYSKFDFFGNLSENKINIYGINNQEEIKIYEMVFSDSRLMEIVYLSLSELFDSRKKINMLEDILEKTEIPVIKPNIKENTPNIIEEVKREFGEWMEENEIGSDIEPNIVEIENEIKELEDEIDAVVFDIYGLEREEVITVLDNLSVRNGIKNNILDKLDNL